MSFGVWCHEAVCCPYSTSVIGGTTTAGRFLPSRLSIPSFRDSTLCASSAITGTHLIQLIVVIWGDFVVVMFSLVPVGCMWIVMLVLVCCDVGLGVGRNCGCSNSVLDVVYLVLCGYGAIDSPLPFVPA